MSDGNNTLLSLLSSPFFLILFSLFFVLFARWLLKTLGCRILHLWDTIIHPLPKVLPGQLPTEEQLEDFYRSLQWARLAYRTKRRYGWRCMRCGAELPARIVTDHIKPLRYNWELKLKRSNMQILCDPCNQWKGARDIDFRSPGLWPRLLKVMGLRYYRPFFRGRDQTKE